MTAIPRPALLLGLAGLLPFVAGAATSLLPGLAAPVTEAIGPRFVGPALLVGYGTVILCFMAGVHWGFVARADGPMAPRAYALSVLPALWVFFFTGTGTGTGQSLSALLVGFLALLALDLQFTLWRLAPAWWMRLRLMLTLVVAACLGAGFHG